MDITGLGSAFDFAKGIMDRFFPKKATEEEKLQIVAQLAPMIEARDLTIVEAQKSIIVAEMQQGDNYTKRARPTVVYAGLAFIALVHVVVPVTVAFVSAFSTSPEPVAVLTNLKTLTLPEEFWWAWTSVCGIWAVGRSMEKRGVSNKLVEMLTGNKIS